MGEIVRYCRLCHQPMETSPFLMCMRCLEERDKVINFINNRPYVSMEEISSTTDVPFEKVEKMVKLGLNKQLS